MPFFKSFSLLSLFFKAKRHEAPDVPAETTQPALALRTTSLPNLNELSSRFSEEFPPCFKATMPEAPERCPSSSTSHQIVSPSNVNDLSAHIIEELPLISSSRRIKLNLKTAPAPILVSTCIVSPPPLPEPMEAVVEFLAPITCPSSQQLVPTNVRVKVIELKEGVVVAEGKNTKTKEEVADPNARLYEPGLSGRAKPSNRVSGGADDNNNELRDEASRLKIEIDHLRVGYQALRLEAEKMHICLAKKEQEISELHRFTAAMADVNLHEPVFKSAYRALRSGQAADAALVASIKAASQKKDSPWASIIPAVVGPRPPDLYLQAIRRCVVLENQLSELKKYRSGAENQNIDIRPSKEGLEASGMVKAGEHARRARRACKEPCGIQFDSQALFVPRCNISASAGSADFTSEVKGAVHGNPPQLDISVVSMPANFVDRLVLPDDDSIYTIRPHIPLGTVPQDESFSQQRSSGLVLSANKSTLSTASAVVTQLSASELAFPKLDNVEAFKSQDDVPPQTIALPGQAGKVPIQVMRCNGSPTDSLDTGDSSLGSLLDQFPLPSTGPTTVSRYLQAGNAPDMAAIQRVMPGLQVIFQSTEEEESINSAGKSQTLSKTGITSNPSTSATRQPSHQLPMLTASRVLGPRHAYQGASGVDQKGRSHIPLDKHYRRNPSTKKENNVTPISKCETLCSKSHATSLIKPQTPPTKGIRRPTVSSTLKSAHFQNSVNGPEKRKSTHCPEPHTNMKHALTKIRPQADLAGIAPQPTLPRTTSTPRKMLDHGRKAVKTFAKFIS
ncbi:hypothetical protein AMATHDRAFT_47835 [Amanita thiersii Skay4041]|uniref:Uncharacterized protein n=1 Tax=Amanita thiersii Skay4041 TaxID=703135 RepID=A0A2A9NS60_9AGAR|nr:hypothetical protein AMATHDRAFT_47835 [Amanita thiersii Skay4041]